MHGIQNVKLHLHVHITRGKKNYQKGGELSTKHDLHVVTVHCIHSISKESLQDIKGKMKMYLTAVEREKTRFKAGYEARYAYTL